MKKNIHIGVLSILWLLKMPIFAQNDSTSRSKELQAITVSSSRFTAKDIQTPFSITVLDQSRLQIGNSKISIFESLGAIPGVFAMNSENFAQDLRISIRGFGARAAFGMRGIKVIMDGIPESIPDGTAKVGNLDVGTMERMEIIKGPSSGLYGNASGGVISIFTENPTNLFAEIQTQIGAYGLQRYQFKTGQTVNKLTYFISASRLMSTGFRANSAIERNFFNGKLMYHFSENIKLTFLANHIDSPRAEDAGGLTQADIDKNRQQARQQNLDFDASETFKQSRIALIYDQKINEKHALNARVFYLNRDFNSKQPLEPSGQIAFQRTFAGGGFNYQFTTNKYRLKTGLDLENQQDNRQRYDNKREGIRSTLRLNQVENFNNVGVFLLQELNILPQLKLSLNTRFDDIELKISDNFLSDGNQSATQSFQRFSPMMGLSFSPTLSSSIYTNISTNFETPSLNELSNNPVGTGGFNPDLNPQKSRNYELGYKGILGKKFRVDASVFYIEVEDEIVPYQLAGQVGRNYFRNAGLSERKGLELGLTYKIFNGLTTYFNYTYSDFRYKSYQTTAGKFDGNTLPGIPKHNIYGEIRYFPTIGLYAIAQVRSISKIYADDANAIENKGYVTVNLRTGYQYKIGNFQLEPFVGVNNVLNEIYNANIQINAAGNRYFEPAQGSFLFGGISLRFGK
ncbi:MAG: TonB-dependent receptor [Arcicella sp.]|nr:TonB-dependent receptor [Arcicella sp.]